MELVWKNRENPRHACEKDVYAGLVCLAVTNCVVHYDGITAPTEMTINILLPQIRKTFFRFPIVEFDKYKAEVEEIINNWFCRCLSAHTISKSEKRVVHQEHEFCKVTITPTEIRFKHPALDKELESLYLDFIDQMNFLYEYEKTQKSVRGMIIATDNTFNCTLLLNGDYEWKKLTYVLENKKLIIM